jgi:hypothetical protein
MAASTKKIILFSSVALALAAAGLGLWMWNKPHKDIKNAKAIDITAEKLYQTFITDSAKAKTTYINQVLEVSGTVTQVSENQQQQQIVFLNTGINGASINCTMESNASDIKPGDQIRIKGVCSGYNSGDADMGLPGDVFLIRGYPTNN